VKRPDNIKAFSTEERYRLLVDSVTDYALYMLDPDGVVISWNSGAARLKGYAEHEIVGRHFSQFYPEEDVRNGMPARTLHIAATEGRFEAEGWRVRKNGERFWAHVIVDPILAPTGSLIGFAKVTRDLSERRTAEESLRRSEEQFRLLVQGVTDYALYMLDPHGIVTSWNAGAQRIKGYAPEEVIGTHFSRFYRREDAALGLPALALATAAAEGRFESEGWRVRRDGTEFRANVVVDPIRDERGEIIGFAKITRDVTEKHQAELALEKAREALFQSQKLDAIGQLTGGVAHDFNNLLMVILTSLELIRRRMPDDDMLKRLVNNAMQGARRGATLTQRMLAFARRQELKPTAVDVPALVLGMRDLLERSLGPTIRLVIEFPAELRSVLIDANQLELAILNLAVNARDAMPQGGTLQVSARLESIEQAGETLADGSYVCLSIVDNGTGMDEQTLAHATEPFFTTKGAGKGTGLGLPMVHGLAAQSGGRLILRSSAGSGTTVELWLPTAQMDAGLLAGPGAPVSQVERAASMLIVAVDDDALVLEGTVSMLQDLGHRVLPANSGPQALEMILKEADVSLLITDQMMPGMTGSELIEKIASVRPRVPAILATGFGEVPADLDRMAVRLRKPYDQVELADAIRKVSSALSDKPFIGS
jgi:PAS domain S-box-containing protein